MMTKLNLLMAAGTADWTIGHFLGNMSKTAQTYVRLIILFLGVVMLGVGVYQVAKNLISHGKGQTNWIVTIALILVGGAFAVSSSWSFIKGLASAGGNTLKDMGSGSGNYEKFDNAGYKGLDDSTVNTIIIQGHHIALN